MFNDVNCKNANAKLHDIDHSIQLVYCDLYHVIYISAMQFNIYRSYNFIIREEFSHFGFLVIVTLTNMSLNS
jgi:hypothetical protein